MIHQKIMKSDLEIGMCVELPPGTFDGQEHFLEYHITTDEELSRIRQTNLAAFLLKFHDDPFPATSSFSEITPSLQNTISKADELLEIIRNPNLQPAEKAEKVYQNSIVLMEALFESPKAECIQVAKDALSEVTNLVLGEPATSMHLMKITAYDHNTYAHSVNVGVLSLSLAKQFYGENSGHDLQELGSAFFLHDIGKTVIPYSILNKPGRLDDDEMDVMKTHPLEGLRILTEEGQLTQECSVIVSQHHEREDGSGYPYGLKSDEIHEYAKICAVADVFDALTMERSYKKQLTTFEALQIMKEQMRGHFDPVLFKKFICLFNFD